MTGWWGGWESDPAVRTAMLAGASQNPRELFEAMELIAAAAPAVILEIGCDSGGSLLAWRLAAPQAAVFGITLECNTQETGGSGRALETHGATVRVGDSHDRASREWLAGQLAGRPVDTLVIDGDHSAAGVRQDLADYGPLVQPGGLILLHDIYSVPPGPWCPVEVPQVWAAVKDRYDTAEIHNPEGGPGWGIIRGRDGDVFAAADAKESSR